MTPDYLLLFGIFMLGMALGALLTTIRLRGQMAIIRDKLRLEVGTEKKVSPENGTPHAAAGTVPKSVEGTKYMDSKKALGERT